MGPLASAGTPSGIRFRILQRWAAYATSGHGGNVELRKRTLAVLRLSVLRLATRQRPPREIEVAESHVKHALDSRRRGVNRT